jgi:hypothetical protein
MAAAGTRVGTGYVDIEPDFSRFQEKVGRKLNQALTPAFRKAGRNAGKELAGGLDRGGLGQALAPLLRRFDKFGDDAGKAIASRIGKGSQKAAGDMFGLAGAVGEATRRSRQASDASKTLGRDMFGIAKAAERSGKSFVSARTQLRGWQATASGAGGVVRRLASRIRGVGYELGSVANGIRTSSGGFSGFDGVMARVNRGFSFLRNILRTLKWPVLIAGAGLAMQGLSALAAAAIATTSALSPLAGALVALPSAALVAAQAFGVLKLATAGVGDALKAAFSAEAQGGQQAVDVMRQQEGAAERVADAKRNLASVQRDATFAQKDLTKARRDAVRTLQDMRLEADRSRDSEQQGALQLRQARKELAKTLRDPNATGLDVRFAEEAIDQARNDLQQTRLDAKRAREDYSAAQKTGVAGMPEVVAAKRAEEDATLSVADAERDLANAVKDSTAAMEDQGSAATAFQEKMALLPPAAQKFVRVLLSLKPRLDELRSTAASGFFPGAEAGLRSVMGNFKEVRSIVGDTAGVLGKVAAKAGKKLGSAVWGKDLTRIGKLNTRILGRMGDAGLNLADAFRHILVSAEPFLDWLSGGVTDLSAWVKGEAAAGRETGRLAGFFDQTRATMERLGPILKGVGGGLLNVSEAAKPLGNEILDGLGGAAEGWRRWTDSTKGQNRLRRYFTETKPAIFEMGRLVRDAGKAFFELGKQRGVADLLRLVRTELVPALRDSAGAITGWASDFIRQFGELRKEGVPTFDAFVRTLADHAGQAGWKIAKALVGAFLNAGIWGKLAITGWLLARFGGLKAFAGIGSRAGGRMGKAMVEKVVAWFAGTNTATSLYVWLSDAVGPSGKLGKVARTGGLRLGKTFGRSMALGAVVGLVLFAPVIRDAIDKYIKDPLTDALGGIFGDDVKGILSTAQDLIDPANLGPAPTAIGKAFGFEPKEFVKGKIQDLEALVVPEPKTEKAEAKLRGFSKDVEREGERARKGFRRQLDPLPEIAERSSQGIYRQTIPRLSALASEGGKKGDAFAGRVGGSFGSLAGTVKSALGNIEENIAGALKSLHLAKAPKFALKNFVHSLPELKPLPERQLGGAVPTGLAAGGLASVVPGHGAGDRHTLSLNGRPVAKVESKEGIFVGNRNLMGVLKQANAAVPRLQGGGFVGRLRRGGLAEPQIAGQDGPLRELGQSAIQKVFKGAKDFLDKHKLTGGALGLTGSGDVETVFAKVAKRLSKSRIATLALGEAGFAESGMRDLGFGDASSEGSLQLLARTAAALAIDPHDEGAVASHFLLRGYYGRGGANALAARGLPAHLVAQSVQGSAFPDGSNYLAQEGAAKGWMRRFGLQTGGLLKGFTRGGPIGSVVQRLAGGGMVDPSWDEGSETIAGSIAQLVAAYAKRFDIDITAGYDPGGGHVSPGHNTTGTATDVVPRDGNWDGSFAKGLETLAGMGFEVGYDGSIPGTQNWPDHGRGNHAHIEWVGNGTGPDARQQLREFLGGAGTASGASAPAAPKEDIPASYRGAKTGPLDLGSMPKTLEGVNKEIARWQGQVGTYFKAKRYAEKHSRPGVAQAIGRNIGAIEGRLAGLRSLRTRLRLQAVKKGLKKRLGKRLGQFAGYEQLIEGTQRGYERSAQDTEQIVALEPQSPELPASATDSQREAAERSYVANFTNYVDTRERPAYAGVLDRIATWRNSILRAEMFGFGKGQPSAAAAETHWEGEDRKVSSSIDHIKEFSKKVGERLAKFKSDNPTEKTLPAWLQKQVNERAAMLKELPILQLKDTELRKAIGGAREKFFPGGENRLKPNAAGIPALPLPGSGSFEGSLEEVQGIHWPDLHELLSASQLAPPRIAGRFGGVIWDVQTSIEELGLKITQAANSLGGPSEEKDAGNPDADELTRQANQRAAVSDTQKATLEGWDEMRRGLFSKLPKFHTGGTVIGPAGREMPIMALGKERIRTPEQELEMAESIRGLGEGTGSGPPTIEAIHIYPDGRATMRYEGQEFEMAVKRVVRGTRGVGQMTPGGARR